MADKSILTDNATLPATTYNKDSSRSEPADNGDDGILLPFALDPNPAPGPSPLGRPIVVFDSTVLGSDAVAVYAEAEATEVEPGERASVLGVAYRSGETLPQERPDPRRESTVNPGPSPLWSQTISGPGGASSGTS